ncbi:hypothetical protein [Glycomyces tarimensis]
MSYPPPGGHPPPPGYGQQPQQPGYPPQQGGYAPQQPLQGQQPGYPPQQPGYGATPPPPIPPPAPPSGGGGVLGKILGSIGGVVLVGVIAVVYFVFGGGGSSDDTDPNNDTLDAEQMEAAEAAEVGDCMADALSAETDDLVVPCDDPNAFWSITQVSSDSGAEVDIMGELTDQQIPVDICGQEVAGWQLGETWKSYQYVYTESVEGLGGPVDYLYCVEAIEQEDANGRLPVTPTTGSCFDDSTDGWWTVDCASPDALYEVIDSEVVDPPAAMTQDEVNAALGGCPDAHYYPWPVEDVDGNVNGILCVVDI